MTRLRMSIICRALAFTILLGISPALAQENTVTFDNQSGEPALVKLVGPSNTVVEVPTGGKRTVSASAGQYHIRVRYGTPGRYRYARGDNFNITETTTQKSEISITLHKVIGGNYGTRTISEEDFGSGSGAKSGTSGKQPMTFNLKTKSGHEFQALLLNFCNGKVTIQNLENKMRGSMNLTDFSEAVQGRILSLAAEGKFDGPLSASRQKELWNWVLRKGGTGKIFKQDASDLPEYLIVLAKPIAETEVTMKYGQPEEISTSHSRLQSIGGFPGVQDVTYIYGSVMLLADPRSGTFDEVRSKLQLPSNDAEGKAKELWHWLIAQGQRKSAWASEGGGQDFRRNTVAFVKPIATVSVVERFGEPDRISGGAVLFSSIGRIPGGTNCKLWHYGSVQIVVVGEEAMEARSNFDFPE